MTKKEVIELKKLYEMVEHIEKYAESTDILKKDEDGGYTHNSYVLVSMLSHVKNELYRSWKKDTLRISDFGEC